METTNEKTDIRKKLEELADDINKSWLHDLDKAKEYMDFRDLLLKVLESEKLEHFFNDNQSDFEYFCGKFSHDAIANILKQHFIFGLNGDETAFEILTAYIQIYLKFLFSSELPQPYYTLFDSIKEIFDSNKSFYKATYSPNQKGVNKIDPDIKAKKQMSSEFFNETILKRAPESIFEFKTDDELDVLIDNKKSMMYSTTQNYHNLSANAANQLNDKKIWTRGRIKNVEGNYLIISIAEDDSPVLIKKTSFDYTLKGSMTSDYDFKINLQVGDLVLCQDRAKKYPATVLNRDCTLKNGLPTVEYKVGFRLYLTGDFSDKRFSKDTLKALAEKHWPDKVETIDSHGNTYIGDKENFDEYLSNHSKRISKLTGGENTTESTYLDDMIKFKRDENSDPSQYKYPEFESNPYNYVIGRSYAFSYFYGRILNFFCKNQGYEKIIGFFNAKEKNYILNQDLAQTSLIIIGSSSGLLHRDYIKDYLLQSLLTNTTDYLSNLSQAELRNVKKDTIDMMLKILRYYLNFTNFPERVEILEKFNIGFSIKMLKTSILDKRISAIKTLVDIIRSKSNSTDDNKELILKIISENKVFNEIYGVNSHIQLINKSKDLLEILAVENRLSQNELEMIWAATKKGDLEGKMTIVKILREISRFLTSDNLKILINKIYADEAHELGKDELLLLFDLVLCFAAIDEEVNFEEIKKLLMYFFNGLWYLKNDDKEKFNLLIKKILELTKKYDECRNFTIGYCLDNIKKNENSVVSFKLLENLINFIEDKAMCKELLIQSFRDYKDAWKKTEKLNKGFEEIYVDNYSHERNLQHRLDFLNILIKKNIWSIEETDPANNPIDFLYEILHNDPISENDKSEFYSWINTLLMNKAMSSRDEEVVTESKGNSAFVEEKVFILFNDKILSSENIKYLVFSAFDSYLKLFFEFNKKLKLLNFERPSESQFEDIIVLTQPDQLEGFTKLWNVIFNTESESIMLKGIEIISALYKNVKYDNKWANCSDQLLAKAIQMISTNMDSKEALNITKKSFQILKNLIFDSERSGTFGVKSHSGLLKKKIITIRVNSFMQAPDFNVKVYGNTTIWDLKEIISRKAEAASDFLNYHYTLFNSNDNVRHDFLNIELNSNDNGKTVMDLNFEDNTEIKIFMNNLESQIPQADLVRKLDNGDVVIDEQVLIIILYNKILYLY